MAMTNKNLLQIPHEGGKHEGRIKSSLSTGGAVISNVENIKLDTEYVQPDGKDKVNTSFNTVLCHILFEFYAELK